MKTPGILEIYRILESAKEREIPVRIHIGQGERLMGPNLYRIVPNLHIRTTTCLPRGLIREPMRTLDRQPALRPAKQATQPCRSPPRQPALRPAKQATRPCRSPPCQPALRPDKQVMQPCRSPPCQPAPHPAKQATKLCRPPPPPPALVTAPHPPRAAARAPHPARRTGLHLSDTNPRQQAKCTESRGVARSPSLREIVHLYMLPAKKIAVRGRCEAPLEVGNYPKGLCELRLLSIPVPFVCATEMAHTLRSKAVRGQAPSQR